MGLDWRFDCNIPSCWPPDHQEEGKLNVPVLYVLGLDLYYTFARTKSFALAGERERERGGA